MFSLLFLCPERKLFEYVSVESSKSGSRKTEQNREHSCAPQHTSFQQEEEISGEGDDVGETVKEAVVELGDLVSDETGEETPPLSWAAQQRGEGGGGGGGGGGTVSVLEQMEGREEAETVFDKVGKL